MISNIIITGTDGTRLPLFSRKNASAVTKAEQVAALLGDDIVNISVQSATPLPVAVGNTIEVYGKIYTLNRPPEIKKTGERRFNYEMVFEGVQYELLDALFLLPENTVNVNSLTGMLSIFVRQLAVNANRVFPDKWTLGDHPSETEYKTLTFGDNENCLSALQRICEEFEQEFEIEQTNGTRILHIRKTGAEFPHTFRYGRTGGLYELTRKNIDSTNIVTRLYVYGGSNNLGSDYIMSRNTGKLCLPDKSKTASYIQDDGAVANFGLKENAKTFDDIFPNRYGEVGEVTDRLTFKDNNMPFDLKESDENGTRWLINGVNAKIHFNTGKLAGYEFELDENGTSAWNGTSQSFKLIPFQDEAGMWFPSEKSNAFQFAPGDKYFFTDINMPDAYIREAETKLAEAAEEYYAKNCRPQAQYELTVDENFIRRFNGNLTVKNLFAVGDHVHVRDTCTGIDGPVRITGFTRDLLKPCKYALTLGESAVKSEYVRRIADQIAVEQIIETNKFANYSKALHNWRTSQEVLSAVFDPDGNYYSDRISPLTVEAMAFLSGAKSMQLALTGTKFIANYNGNKNSIRTTGGVLTHYTVDNGNERSWILADGTTTLNNSKAHYMYARCSRTGNGGAIVFSAEQIKTEQDSYHYHFWIGMISSTDAETQTRYVTLTYGSTMTSGRFIKTGRIQSMDETTYFDLDEGEIGGRINFKNGLVSGDIGIGNANGINAGMSGSGNDGNSVRIWAGATTERRADAPFRIMHDGSLTATNADIKGKIEASGGIATGVKVVSSDTTLTTGDSLVLLTGQSDITVNLPPSPNNGQMIAIKNLSTQTATVSGNGKGIFPGYESLPAIHPPSGRAYMLIYAANYGWAVVGTHEY